MSTSISTSEESLIVKARRSDSGQDHLLLNAKKMIRRYRMKIVRYVVENASSTGNQTSLSTRLQGVGEQLSLLERLALFAKPAAANREQEYEERWKDSREEDLEVDLEPVRDMLISSNAFHSLVSKLQRKFYRDEESLQEIRISVENRRLRREVYFDMDWPLETFMRTQYGENIPSIGSVVVITGSALYAQATTCAEYMKQTWHDGGVFLLALLDSVLGNVNDVCVASGRDGNPFRLTIFGYHLHWFRTQSQRFQDQRHYH